jgi:quinohemoprotein ethanol dehydrogenase
MVFIETGRRPAGLVEGMFTVAGLAVEDYDPQGLARLMGGLPSLDSLRKDIAAPVRSRGVLRALDPVSGKIVWEQPSASWWDGGVLSTGGGLVFQGDSAGQMNVYAAASGKPLAHVALYGSVMAAPMTYRAGGTQYVAVLAGYGGGNLGMPLPRDSAAYRYGNNGRLIALRLDGGRVPEPASVADAPFEQPPPRAATPNAVARGEVLYNRYCARCHVLGRGVLPDLRRMSSATHTLFDKIVLGGAYASKGMARWDDVLTQENAEAIHAFVLDQAWQAFNAEHATAAPAH